MPGVILSQLEMHTRASAQWALTMYSTESAMRSHDWAGGRACRRGPPGDTSVDGNGELLGQAPACLVSVATKAWRRAGGAGRAG